MQIFISKIKRFTNSHSTVILLALASVYSLLVIISNFNVPLWYDEAWRADLIRRGLFGIPYAHAPITIIYYLLNRFIDLFSETNFSQRILDYLVLLILPFVVYTFCKLFFNKSFANLMIIATFLSGYIIENSSIDKPYLLDVIVTLILIVAYKKFLIGKLKLVYFTLMSVILSLLSFSALFILPSLSILMFYKWFRYKTFKLKDLIIWSASWIVVNLMQLIFFVKPQLANLLYQHWSGLFLTGGPVAIIEKVLSNIGTIFGFSIGPESKVLFLETSNIFWNNLQFKLFIYPVNISGILASIYLILFIVGIYRIYRDYGYDLLLIMSGIFILQLATGIISKWPFGNARSNIFSLFLIYLVFVYGAYSIINFLLRHSKSMKLLGIGVTISFTLLLFPYSHIADLINKNTALSQPAVGMEGAVIQIAMKSKPNDSILVSNTPGPLGFQYYYTYSDYTKEFRNLETKNIIYTYNPNDYMIMPNLKIYKPKTLWVVLYRYYIPNVIYNDLNQIRKHGYVLNDTITSKGLLVYRFIIPTSDYSRAT